MRSLIHCVFVFGAAQKTVTCGVRSVVCLSLKQFRKLTLVEQGHWFIVCLSLKQLRKQTVTCGVKSLVCCVFVFETAQKTDT